MKAAVYEQYGPPDVIQIRELDKPVPKDNEVLIAVRAAAINPLDKYLLGGRAIIRPMVGLRKPKVPRLGVDLAGRIEAVGKDVTQFKIGDEVYGVARGSIAEYVCAVENKIALKPANASFEEAAGVPVAGSTALQGLRDVAHLQAGQKILINAAAGGIGHFAVQIAKSFGAEVTAVCSTKSVETVLSLGADHVIDYTRDDFVQNGGPYDVTLDSAGNRSIAEFRRIMTPTGIHIMNGGDRPGLFGPLTRLAGGRLLSLFIRQSIVTIPARITQPDLVVLKDLIESGKVRTVIDQQFPLSETVAAMRHFCEGHARGKTVITM